MEQFEKDHQAMEILRNFFVEFVNFEEEDMIICRWNGSTVIESHKFSDPADAILDFKKQYDNFCKDNPIEE